MVEGERLRVNGEEKNTHLYKNIGVFYCQPYTINPVPYTFYL